MRNTSIPDCHTSPKEAEGRGAHEAGVEDEICGGGRRPLCSCCLLSGLLPHLLEQVGGAIDHIAQVDRRRQKNQHEEEHEEAIFQVPIEGGDLPKFEKSPLGFD